MSGSKSFDPAYDYPPMSQPSSKPILTFDKDNPLRFTDLLDTINNYTGYGGFFLMVNLTEDGVTVSPVEVETDKHYEHNQTIPALEWLVNHDLNKYPSVEIIDSAGRVVIGEVQYIDANNLAVRFEILFSGKVYCN